MNDDSTADAFAKKRQELGAARVRVEREIAALREKLAEIDLELGAIAAYDEYKNRRTRSQHAQVQARIRPGDLSRELVLAVVAGEAGGMGVGRGEIIEALGVKGNRSGEIAVDNRLRELKREGSVIHEARLYRVP